MSPQTESPPTENGRAALVLRLASLGVLLYLFLVSIKLLSSGIKMLGSGAADGLFDGVSHPLAALAVGILATALVQSSSVTTSTIVALVGSGTIGVVAAVPMIMGANIGTTVTNTLVSLGSVTQPATFRRAFAAATVHDFFNLLTVLVFLPIELMTGILAKSAHGITNFLIDRGYVGSASAPGESFNSPVKTAVTWGADHVKGVVTFLTEGTEYANTAASASLITIGLIAIFLSLGMITKTMRAVIQDKAERALNAALKRSAIFAIGIGAVVTMIVQSSSVTTSLLVPLCASGVLSLTNTFPLVLGANIGTTVTAFMAALATDRAGIEIAVVHVLFNVIATATFYPILAIRRIPIMLADRLSVVAVRNRSWVVVYIIATFILLPMAFIYTFK